jgi:O-antigen/teichoic acid export membrane protein
MAERHVAVFVALAAGKVVAMACTVLAPMVIGRALGAEVLGRWVLLIAAGTLLHTALLNWTHASTVRYGKEEWLATHRLTRTLGARIPLLAAGAAIAVLVLMAQPGRWAERWFGAAPSDAMLIALVAISVWMAAEAQATLQATDRISWQASVAPVVALASIAALLLWAASGSRSLALAVLAFSTPPAIGWAATWLAAIARSHTRLGDLTFDDTARHLRYAAPVIPTFALGYVSDWGDHVLLSRYSTLAEVGQFALAYQFMVAAMAAGGVLVTVMLPRLIAHELTQPGYMRTYLEREVPTLCALWMLGTIWVVAAMPLVVRLIAGAQFDDSLMVLQTLLIVVPASVVSSLFTVLFSVQERMGRSTVFLFVTSAVNVGLSLLLIPRYGALGAAAATVASYVVYQASYVWDQHRLLGVAAGRTWTLWTAAILIGAAQWPLGSSIAMRAGWAALTTVILLAVVRMVGAIDGGVVARVFGGRLQPVGTVITRVLAAPGPVTP